MKKSIIRIAGIIGLLTFLSAGHARAQAVKTNIPLILAALLSCCARRNGVRLQALFVWRDTGADANSAARR